LSIADCPFIDRCRQRSLSPSRCRRLATTVLQTGAWHHCPMCRE
jgi:hypothetical protein